MKVETDSEDEAPLNTRKKAKTEKKEKKKKRVKEESDYDEEDDESDYGKSKKKKAKKEPVSTPAKKPAPRSAVKTESPAKGGRKKKADEEEPEVWKWWEEEKKNDGTKWSFLEHKGPMFAPPYEPLPESVLFEYNGKKMRLSEDAEEIAGFYARLLDHEYTSKVAFNNNFFKDWRKSMNKKERELITDLHKCNFRHYQAYFAEQTERNRNRTKEEKLALKEKNEAILKEYGIAIIDGHKEKIGNFKIEPPGLFRGRGEHPKMGTLKRRIVPEDIIINCSKDSKIPQPPKGHRWKEVRHDNTVTWLASWTENVQNQVKYIMLNPSSKIKGEKDYMKYEVARRLKNKISKIRDTYMSEWKSKEMRVRQRAVALYFIDKLALRAGEYYELG
jgi:DNA topoisomerase I